MFYCNDCAEEFGLPANTPERSAGPCDLCDTVELCNYIPDTHLPASRAEKRKRPSHQIGRHRRLWKG